MFRYIIVVSCIFAFSFTKPQAVANKQLLGPSPANYFDSLSHDLELHNQCVVNVTTLRTSDILVPCNRPIPSNVTSVGFVYNFQLFLCMGVYDCILHICELDPNRTTVNTLLVASKESIETAGFCARLQGRVEFLNTEYTQTTEWVSHLKQNLRNETICNRSCIDSDIGVNPLCSYIYEATTFFSQIQGNKRDSTNTTSKADDSNSAKENRNNAPDPKNDNAAAKEPPPVVITSSENKTVAGIAKGSTLPIVPKETEGRSVDDHKPKNISDSRTPEKPKDKDNISITVQSNSSNVDPPKPKPDTANTSEIQRQSDSAKKIPGKSATSIVTSPSSSTGEKSSSPTEPEGKISTNTGAQAISAGEVPPPTKELKGENGSNINQQPNSDQQETTLPKEKSKAETDHPQQSQGNTSATDLGTSTRTSDAQINSGIERPLEMPEIQSESDATDSAAGDLPAGDDFAKQPSYADSNTDIEISDDDDTRTGEKDGSEVKADSHIQPSSGETPGPQGSDNLVVAEDSHFFVYFVTMVVLCIIGYLAFHNKQKILALTLEGHSRRGSRRRQQNTTKYRKLDSNLEEAVTSSCKQSTTSVIY